MPKNGDQRHNTFFAIWPVYALTKYGVPELRWLETVTVQQEYISFSRLDGYWRNIGFIDPV